MMPTIDRAEAILDEIANELPPVFFEELNGGICLLPESRPSPEPDVGELYILGEYHQDNMGRTIYIYYGSFECVYGPMSERQLRKRLRETLLHEFTHHWESLGGERDLEIRDEERMWRYREEYRDR